MPYHVQSQVYPSYANPPDVSMGQSFINPQRQSLSGIQIMPPQSLIIGIPILKPRMRDQSSKCGICNKEIKGGSIQLQNCGHKVHIDCLVNTYKGVKSNKCPIANCDKELSREELNRLQSKGSQNQSKYHVEYYPRS
jgi:hypothetical protein